LGKRDEGGVQGAVRGGETVRDVRRAGLGSAEDDGAVLGAGVEGVLELDDESEVLGCDISRLSKGVDRVRGLEKVGGGG